MKVELLAPAGTFENLTIAINSGADAVYLGLDSFNARGNIENFNKANLRDAVEFAHLFGVKVYLTLNTLIKDEEFNDVLEKVRFAVQSKVDAFIVQDIGLASTLKQCFEGIELHASTQMGICNYEGAKFLSELGFKRVVLARETPLYEIKRIKENLDIEIEYFIHGAMCVGYSGNCYFSSLEENASGNRGKCKQLCRLPYEMEYDGKKKNGYLLSIKDNCMLAKMRDLVEAGVTSFKIEGRARRGAYVASAVSVYRKVLDNCYIHNDEDLLKLKKSFNRGNFTTGYLDNNKMIYPQIPSHIGVEIGKVVQFKRGKKFNEIIINSIHEIARGDVLQFVGKSGVSSISVYDVKPNRRGEYLITTTCDVENNSRVNLLVDKVFEEKILSNEKKLEVNGCFQGKIGERAKLTLKYKDIEACADSEEICEKSISQPLTYGECFNQLSKMGDYFILQTLQFESEDIFIRKSTLNEMRRKALEKLKNKIIESNEINLKIKENKFNLILNSRKTSKNTKNILIFNKISQFRDSLLNNYLEFSPSIFNKEEIMSLAARMGNNTLYLDTPVFATKEDILFLKEICKSCKNIGLVANNYYALNLVSPEKTIIGSEMNVYNSCSIEFYRSQGYNKIILSKEDVNIEIGNKEGLFVHHNIKERLIYFKHCPIKEHIGGDCGNCHFKEGIIYSLAGKQFELKRVKLKSCIFYLRKTEILKRNNDGFGKVEEL